MFFLKNTPLTQKKLLVGGCLALQLKRLECRTYTQVQERSDDFLGTGTKAFNH